MCIFLWNVKQFVYLKYIKTQLAVGFNLFYLLLDTMGFRNNCPASSHYVSVFSYEGNLPSGIHYIFHNFGEFDNNRIIWNITRTDS